MHHAAYGTLIAAFTILATAAPLWAGSVAEQPCDDCYMCIDFAVEWNPPETIPYDSLPAVTGTICWDPAYISDTGYGTVKLGEGLISFDVWVDYPGGPSEHYNDIDDANYIEIYNGKPEYIAAYFGDVYFNYTFILIGSLIEEDYFDGDLVFGEPRLVCEVIPTPAAAGAGLTLLGLLAVKRRRGA